MEPNNYNSVHILSEAVIMGGISMYFYKKISELETTIEDLKSQVMMQHNQIRYLLTGSRPTNVIGSNQPQISSNSVRSELRNTTPLKIPSNLRPQNIQKENFSNGSIQPKIQQNHIIPNYALEQQQREPLNFSPPPRQVKDQLPPSSIQEIRSPSTGEKEPPNVICEGGVCKLVLPNKKKVEQNHNEKKVAISKISKQIEFDRENMDLDQTSKVNTFTNFSPNPVLKSVTPKPSTSISESCDGTDLEKILNDIDDE